MNFKEFRARYQKCEIKHYPSKVQEKPLLSVIVQTYNHERFISQCLNSILKQKTNFPFEILLGEDTSKDTTRIICQKYAHRFPEKIRLFLHHPNNKIHILGVPTGNFNAIYNLFQAKGRFIAFCEGDDIWQDPLKLQKQVDLLLVNPNIAFNYHSFIEVNENEEPLPIDKILDQPVFPIDRNELKTLTYHPLLSTVCFRNYFIEGIPEEFPEVINVDSFLISLLGNYGTAEYMKNITPSYYRRHEGGIWSGRIKELKLRSKILTFQQLSSYYRKQREHRMENHFNSLIKETSRILLLSYLREYQPQKAFRLLKTLF
ncbi:glycosyltransferase [Salinimicrobium sp. WS361]|uniref:glycosyltransferase n=1 Tax=Salinimicrobium sp. WS361 TaxID=3425123 RepID=UPI003D6EE41E